MVTQDTKNKVKALYKKLKSENINNLSITKCNGYIRQLNYLKNLLYSIGDHWVEDMEEVSEVESDFAGEVDKEDFEETMEQVSEQIELIMTNLGLEENENFKKDTLNSSPTNINISPTFAQSQSTNVSVETQVSNLYQEFEKELIKPNPDKLKLKDIVKTIIKFLGFVF